MQDIKIDGVGKLYGGGEYRKVVIDGVAECEENLRAQRLEIDGKFQCSGNIDVEELHCDGIAKFLGYVHAKRIELDGYVAVENGGDFAAREILCDGGLKSDGQISADHLFVDGFLDAKEIVGEKIEIHSTPRAVARLFTRQGCKAELIEATELYLEGVKAEEVNGQHITVGRGCVIERLDCNGTLHIEGNAVIHQITGSYTNV